MRLKKSPDGSLFVWDAQEERWIVWSPNGEYWESVHGDSLTEDEAAEWCEVTL